MNPTDDEGPPETGRDSASGRILVVDDDPGVLRTGLRLLRRAGFEVVGAVDGQAALECLDKGSFDAVVTDISMPNLTGIELLRQIRRHDLDLPVVLVTAFPELESAIEAVQHGALSYLTKPYDGDELRNVTAKAVRLHRLALLKREAVDLVADDLRRFGDRMGLETAFERAFDSMWMAYQPLVSGAEERVVAYEGLLRTEEPSLANPLNFIAAAQRLGRLRDVGRKARALVAEQVDSAPAELLFVNLHPSDLLDEELYRRHSPLARRAERVVLEITERESLENVPGCEARVDELHRLGFRVAVDDLGAGYAGLSSFALLEPDVVKFDMSMVRGVDTSPLKQRLLGSMANLFRQMHIMTVAEGVETPEEGASLARLGCDVLQGFLYARPASGFPEVSWPTNGSPEPEEPVYVAEPLSLNGTPAREAK